MLMDTLYHFSFYDIINNASFINKKFNIKMKLSIFIKMLLVPVVFFSSLAFVEAQNIGSLKDVVPAGFSFKKDLLPGDTDSDITQLQKVLNADPDTTVSVSGDGSVGKETTYFGEMTKQAVIKFQQKYSESILIPAGLTKGNGNVGKSTRTRLNLLIGVMNTEDSTGRVQNRTAVTTTSPVVRTSQVVQTTNTATQSAICNLVNLLISIDAISQNNASRALGIFGCASSYTYNPNTGGTPSVDLRVNGSNGPLTFSSDRTVTVSWTSQNVTSCQSSRGARETSGSDSIRIEESGNFVISCSGPNGTVSDSVSVTLRGNNNSDLEAYCYPSLRTVDLNQPVVWVAGASGGADADYRYSWSGSDSLSGSNYSVTKSYTTAGSKSASITVRSDDERDSVSCGNVTVTSSTSSSTPTNPFTPLPGYFLPVAGSQSATTTGQASLLINGTTSISVSSSETYNLSYDTAGLLCTATRTPAEISSYGSSPTWSGSVAQRAGTRIVSGLGNNIYSAIGYGKVGIFGPDGTLLEQAEVGADTGVHARFSKKGSLYPDGSVVSIQGSAPCLIGESSGRVESCIPAPGTAITYTMTCTLPASTSSVSSYYTNTSANITWPIIKTAVVNVGSSTASYPHERFLWKPMSEHDNKLLVLWGSLPEEPTTPGVATNFGGTIVGVGTCDPNDGNNYKDFAVKQSDGSTVVLGWWAGRVDFTPKMGCTILGGAGWSKGKPKCTAYKPSEGTISGTYIGMVYPPTSQDCTGVADGATGRWWQNPNGDWYYDSGAEGDGVGPSNRGSQPLYSTDDYTLNPDGTVTPK
jgi:peptidoglycan hydrolase-like protein with peptidoglycan-binding domain